MAFMINLKVGYTLHEDNNRTRKEEWSFSFCPFPASNVSSVGQHDILDDRVSNFVNSHLHLFGSCSCVPVPKEQTILHRILTGQECSKVGYGYNHHIDTELQAGPQ